MNGVAERAMKRRPLDRSERFGIEWAKLRILRKRICTQ
jgi:hypothetical protein